MSIDYNLASSEVMALTTPTPDIVLTDGVPAVLWSSIEMSQGSQHGAVTVSANYEAITPDGNLPANQPFDFECVMIVEVKNTDGTWTEIGRQNNPIRLSDQAPKRDVIISPSVNAEDGEERFVQGFGGANEIGVSKRENGAEGTLRVCVLVIDNDTAGNAFESVTMTIDARRYDPV